MSDKVALVTGGTGGIGRETCLEFARKGVKVAFTGRRQAQGEETLAKIQEAGGEGLFIKADVSKEEDCARMVEETVQKFGRLDYAFNNAGIEGAMGPVAEATPEQFHQVMDINVLGVLMSMKYESIAMLKTGGGGIVNNASVAGVIGMPGISIYAASKHAVLGMTKVAGLEYAPMGIRVNAVSPGAIQTDMLDRFVGGAEEAKERVSQMSPMQRAGNPSEIAKAVVFMCSEDASFMTGNQMIIDGGLTAM